MILGWALSKIGVKFLGLTAIVAILGLGYWHYTSLLKENTRLVTENTLHSATNVTLRDAIGDWQVKHIELVEDVKGLQNQLIQAREETRNLNDIFGRHDLTKLAQAKPKLIERRINDGTARAGRLLVEATTPGGNGTAATSPD